MQSLTGDSMQTLMNMAAPSLAALQKRTADNFNQTLQVFVKRLQSFFPAHAVDLQMVANQLSTAANADDFRFKPITEWHRVCGPHLAAIAQKDESFIETIQPLNDIDLPTLWATAEPDAKKKMWGFIIKLSAIAAEFDEAANNDTKIMQNNFQRAAAAIAEFETTHGRKADIGDMGDILQQMQQR